MTPTPFPSGVLTRRRILDSSAGTLSGVLADNLRPSNCASKKVEGERLKDDSGDDIARVILHGSGLGKTYKCEGRQGNVAGGNC